LSATAPAVARLTNPFPGLRPFVEQEQHLFFGRESQVDTMIDKLSATRFLAVVGTSGSGKSSLVNCGLKPALRRGSMASAGTSWRMAHFRPGSDPIRAMAQALVQPDGLFRTSDIEGMSVQEIVEATLRMSKLGLVDAYEQSVIDQSPNLLVIVDQFEELFRYRNLQPSTGGEQGSDEKAIAFVNLLLEAAASPQPIYVVITMRSDYLGDCAQFEGLPEAINRGQYLVPRMSRDERRSAIAGPAAVAGGDISPILLTRLVNDVGDNPDQLSILQHALNRTWAEWQRQGDAGAMDLPHYEAVGTMTHALDYHAEKAYGELQGDQQKRICEKVFQAITDKGTDARGIRRPTSAASLCAITGVSVAELTSVLAAFRKPSRSFVMPSVSDTIESDTVVDISHESLMRVWNRLKTWVEDEAESAKQYQRLVENSSLHAKGAAGLMTDPELSLSLDWREKQQPNAAWGERYRLGFDVATRFLEASRKARDAAVEAEKERQRRELRRTRMVAAVLGAAFLLAVVFGGYAIYQQRRASAEEAARLQSDKLREAQQKLAEEQERGRKQAEKLNQKLSVALNEAKVARAEAEAANARAEYERKLVITAIGAQAAAQLAENQQLEKDELIEVDRSAGKDAATIARDTQARDAAAARKQALKIEAAQKSSEAVAVVDHASLLSPAQISGSDLFDISKGTVVTDWSGRGADTGAGAGSSVTPVCGEFSTVTNNPMDMFSGIAGSPCKATVFADKQPVGTEHWISWKTPHEVTVRSIAVFAAHDEIRLRRSFSGFKFYVKKQGQWIEVTEYSPQLSPAYMYGGSCGAKPCAPAPAKKYAAGSVLAVCIEVPPTTGQEFRAGFVQNVSSVERNSAPRVLQLDGYSQPGCKK